VNCEHCGCLIAEHEHRCRRCGRRIAGAPAVYPLENSSAVPAPAPERLQEKARSQPAGPPRQESLFGAERSKVIPFESISAGRAARERVARARTRTAPRQQAPAPRANQQSLDFRPRAARQQTIHDEAPIAPPGLRLQAALLDALICVCGMGVAAAAYHLAGGVFALPLHATALYGGVAAALMLFYHLYWSVLGRETPGMRLFGLRVLTFDGAAPNWRLRVLRLAATGLSLLSAGLGLVWSLVDEEKLTWHDHISKTFPTLLERHPRTFHRK